MIFNYKQITPRTMVIDRSLVLLIAFLKEYSIETVRDSITNHISLSQSKRACTKGINCQTNFKVNSLVIS